MVEKVRGSQESAENRTVVEKILDGTATLTFAGKQFETKVDGGHEWSGESYVYNLSVPNHPPSGQTWETSLTVWEPSPVTVEQYGRKPRRQITIHTGHGEMLLTQNKDREEKIWKLTQQTN